MSVRIYTVWYVISARAWNLKKFIQPKSDKGEMLGDNIRTQQLATLCFVILEKFIVTQMIKKFPILRVRRGSLHCSQNHSSKS